MSLAHVAIPIDGQPYRYCTHFGGQAWGDPSVVWCLRDDRRVTSQPERGCAFFLRLTGVDDDLEPPLDGGGGGGEPAWRPILPPYPTRPKPPAPHRSSSARTPLAL